MLSLAFGIVGENYAGGGGEKGPKLLWGLLIVANNFLFSLYGFIGNVKYSLFFTMNGRTEEPSRVLIEAQLLLGLSL